MILEDSNFASWSCENGEYLASITDNSVSTCEEIIEEAKIIIQILMKKKQPVKQKKIIFYLPFYQLL